MSGRIYWLASYPKSGNTWMRVLLSNYKVGNGEPVNINDLETGPIASSRSVFDDSAGVESSDFSNDEIDCYRPFVYEQVSDQLEEDIFCKVHDAYVLNKNNVPLFPKQATAGVIYLIRHPLDVCVSYAYHSASSLEYSAEDMNNENHELAGSTFKLNTQLRQRLLSWSGHVNSWVFESGLRVLVVRYEDLLENTAEEFSRVLDFSGIEVVDSQVASAVSFSQLNALQSQEKKHGFDEKLGVTKKFFRKGKSGSWKDEMSTDMVAQLSSKHAEVMAKFGYTTEA